MRGIKLKLFNEREKWETIVFNEFRWKSNRYDGGMIDSARDNTLQIWGIKRKNVPAEPVQGFVMFGDRDAWRISTWVFFYTYPHEFFVFFFFFWLRLAGYRCLPLAGSQSISFLFLFIIRFYFVYFFLWFFSLRLSVFLLSPLFWFFFFSYLWMWMFVCNAHSAYVSFGVSMLALFFLSFSISLSLSLCFALSARPLLFSFHLVSSAVFRDSTFILLLLLLLLWLQLSKCRNLTGECVAVKVKKNAKQMGIS